MKYLFSILFAVTVSLVSAQGINDLVINEFMASNATTAADQDGEYDDWIELYNNGTSSIDISGYFLTDDPADLTQWTFPLGTVIGPDSYLIIWADDDEQEGLHATFKLSGSGESVILIDANNVIVDEIDYAEQTADISFARIPNGTGDFQLSAPTFATSNESTSDCSYSGGDMDNDGICADEDCDDNDPVIGAAQQEGIACDDGDATTQNDEVQADGCSCVGIPISISDLVINEFMASNDSIVVDQDGEYEDWIELYNNGTSSIDLSGYFLTDDPSDMTQWTFPQGTSIAPDGYLIIWADGDEDQEGLHASFKLSATEESIMLIDDTGMIVDVISYAEQTTDISFGRFPNGTGDFQEMNSTFNAENVGTTTSTSNPILESINISITPNPTQSLCYLEIHELGVKDVVIYDLNGKITYQSQVSNNEYIDVSSWVNGMYILRVDNTFVKMIKQ